MKKGILSIVLASVLAIAVIGAGCGCNGTELEDVYAPNAYEQLAENKGILTKKSQLSGLSESMVYNISRDSNLGVFNKYDATTGYTTYSVYNFESDSVVATFTDSANTEYTDVSTWRRTICSGDAIYDYFVVTKTVTVGTTYALYAANGTKVAESEDAPTVKLDTIFVGGDYYRIVNGTLTKAGTIAKNVAENLPYFDAKNGGNYYEISEGQLFVYNESYVLTGYYKIPTYAKGSMNVLDDGNVLIQYTYAVPMFEEEYTYFDYSEDPQTEQVKQTKYVVKTLIYDVEDNETEEVKDVNYIISNFKMSRSTEKGSINDNKALFNEDIENVATISLITDKRIDTTRRLAAIDNDGDMELIDELFFAQTSDFVVPISNGRFIYTSKTGAQYLVNAKGEVLADVTGAEHNAKYIVLNDAIYDHDFNLLKTLDKGWDVVRDNNYLLGKNSLILTYYDSASNTYTAYLLVDGNLVSIWSSNDNNKEIAGYNDSYFMLKNGNSYTIYNEANVALHTSETRLYYIGTTRNGKVLFSGYNNGTYEHYVFFA